MEIVALLFVIGVFIALISPEPEGKKPSAGDDLLKGLKAAAGKIFNEDILAKKDPPPKPKLFPFWMAMLLAIALGLLLTYL